MNSSKSYLPSPRLVFLAFSGIKVLQRADDKLQEDKTSSYKICSMLDSFLSLHRKKCLFLLTSNVPPYKLFHSINIYRETVYDTMNKTDGNLVLGKLWSDEKNKSTDNK